MSNGVTVLPDGSAFAVGSFPLPKDHWLYAPRGEWDSERDEYAECPRPILTNAQREAVIAAARYAIRGATMCGQEPDLDPDALALNFAYALCGPAGGALLPADAGDLGVSPYLPTKKGNTVSNDPWIHRSDNMKCKTCMWFVPKAAATHPLHDNKHNDTNTYDLGRCRRHAPSMGGYPVVMVNDWCGDHRIDENKFRAS